MFARTLSQWAFVILVTVGASAAVAQERGVSIAEAPTQTLSMRPGFQREIALRGNAKIGTIHVGDDTVARVVAVSDKKFVITALPAAKDAAPLGGSRQTDILVRDTDQNVIASLEVVINNYDEETHLVVIHRPLGGVAGGVAAKGTTQYQCSSVICYLVSEEKAELPLRVPDNVNIQQSSPQQTSTPAK